MNFIVNCHDQSLTPLFRLSTLSPFRGSDIDHQQSASPHPLLEVGNADLSRTVKTSWGPIGPKDPSGLKAVYSGG